MHFNDTNKRFDQVLRSAFPPPYTAYFRIIHCIYVTFSIQEHVKMGGCMWDLISLVMQH